MQRPTGAKRPAVTGLGCQTSSVCYLACAFALLHSRVSPFLVASMFCIFVFSLDYRWILHAPAPGPRMCAHLPLAKKLDGLFIMHMSIAWATGYHLGGFFAAVFITFVLGDPHAVRTLVFVTSMSATCVALWRFGQHAWMYGYMVCNVLALGAFAVHYVDGDRWTLGRLWAWHGCTAISFGLAVVGMEDAEPATRGYPTRGFLYFA
ncbi:hypothetical protein T492DRAFT_1074514 [Pavlovales sp. CCMP2436]|nr:hypothetical protein T492DRAFT_1074514 [Pavlovales sp. CCMP2436]|mmetsp:Transcript_424/g.1198  ORF Transcript_424/g.1198 Transcript_424/m.1198 type:complete len:206 (-) Transcript_424:185-802(-)